MRFLHILILVLFVGCGPGIRYRPGEIPSPSTTDLNDIRAGHQLHAQMVAQGPILRDKAAEKRVTKILQKLLDATPSTGHWSATLLDTPDFNAMTAPGNFIFVYRGLLDSLPDDEVAAVLAHEIAHRLAQHEVESSGEIFGKTLSVLATIAAGAAVATQQGATQQDIADVMNATNKLGTGFTTLRYSKDKEREADQIAIFLLADAGVNPNAAASLWARQTTINGSSGSDFFSTHPRHADRYTMAVQLLPLAQERYQQALKRKKSQKPKRRAPPSSPELTYQISQAEEALKADDLSTASTIAQSLTAQAPAAPETYNLLGRIKIRSGDEKQAIKAFKKGLNLAPDDPFLVYNMACVHALAGKRKETLSALEKAFKLRPELATYAKEDSDLAAFHEDLEFKELTEREYVVLPPMEVGGNTVRVN